MHDAGAFICVLSCARTLTTTTPRASQQRAQSQRQQEHDADMLPGHVQLPPSKGAAVAVVAGWPDVPGPDHGHV